LNDIIENSYDGIYITDRRGKTIMVNKAYERISGIPRDTIIGEYMSNLVASGLLSTSLTDEVVSSKETVTRTQRNRNDKEVVITGNPVFDEKGEVRHVITNVRDITELVNLNTKLAAESSRADLYQEQILRKAADENIAYGSREFENVLNLCSKVSKMDSTVLILGETGVGKEIVAQYIHKHSPRKSKPYIKINCGAIPQNLLESELFGYVSGAFTGANAKGKPGRFELADTGTLFLDEIGELPLNLQASLLRVLQDSEITRIGDSKSKKVDVRIITATNRNLESMIQDGSFRSDLYYRLNVVSINIPPLRERKLDIPPLAEKTIQDLNRKYNTKKSLSSGFVRLLTEHSWPGNIRELKNFIEKQFVLSDSDVIDAAVSPNTSVEIGKNTMMPKESSEKSSSKLPTYEEARSTMERDLFKRAMEQGKSTYKAAALLGMSQSTFFRKYKEVFPKEVR
ncbi:MAG: sigma 54-interacting transcriptional regulator, partial [Firmicutes bacterium]|nr:sigma 54-interacting transcriptional regulator [Bacillota bacterium]